MKKVNTAYPIQGVYLGGRQAMKPQGKFTHLKLTVAMLTDLTALLTTGPNVSGTY
ncbi:hypothetical protein KCM76_13570 [Zooshikella marina]|uniref:hypothetical protein n=1 Tax=Zooshikella ganghwensis TaxID=202772 RepID=UPI000416D459|nr:hypothetical protein [Zooshikella ganghwensis]MBU2707018.1 hypothetical protein [Zooshikella ganghwensis]